MARGFTPRQVEAVEPKVREFVIERIEKLRANGGGDIVAELFAAAVDGGGAHYLGCLRPTAASSTVGRMRSWRPTPPRAAWAERWKLGDALGEMMGYFTALIERRRTEPEDDTVSHLVSAGIGADGDIAGVLSILAFTFTMVTGGNDTTTGMLGGTVQLLHQRPDQRRPLVEDIELIPRRRRRVPGG